eukprot:3391290-Alexandrium_andersonii.AAC.1
MQIVAFWVITQPRVRIDAHDDWPALATKLGEGRCGLAPPCLDLAFGDFGRGTGRMRGGYCDLAEARGD